MPADSLRTTQQLISEGRAGEAVGFLDRQGGLQSGDIFVLVALRLALEACGRSQDAQAAILACAEVRARRGYNLQAITELKVALRVHSSGHGRVHERLADLWASMGLLEHRQAHIVAAAAAYLSEGECEEALMALERLGRTLVG